MYTKQAQHSATAEYHLGKSSNKSPNAEANPNKLIAIFVDTSAIQRQRIEKILFASAANQQTHALAVHGKHRLVILDAGNVAQIDKVAIVATEKRAVHKLLETLDRAEDFQVVVHRVQYQSVTDTFHIYDLVVSKLCRTVFGVYQDKLVLGVVQQLLLRARQLLPTTQSS